jgi:sugar phosphate isomerase/epimerase
MEPLMTTILSRRDFVRSSGFVAASAAASYHTYALPHEFPPPGADPAILLGLASYTFRNFNRDKLINFIRLLNLSSVNLKDVKDHLPSEPKLETDALEDYGAAGIKLHAAGTIYFDKDEDADIRSKFEYCKRAGIPVIVAGDPALETLPRIEKFVREFDIRFAIHNHGPEDKLWHSPLDVLKAVKSLDPRIGCCIDVGHTVRTGTDVVQAIHEVGPRLFNVHLKDLTDFHDKESQVAVGDGKMPVPKIFQALAAIGYKGFVDLEYEVHPDDPIPGVIASFAYMRGVLAGIGYANPR